MSLSTYSVCFEMVEYLLYLQQDWYFGKAETTEQKILFSFSWTIIFLTAYMLSQSVSISRIIKETWAWRASITLETWGNWQTAWRVRAARQWVQIFGPSKTPQQFLPVLHRWKDSSVPCLRKPTMVCCSQLKIPDRKSSFRPLMPSSTRVSLWTPQAHGGAGRGLQSP